MKKSMFLLLLNGLSLYTLAQERNLKPIPVVFIINTKPSTGQSVLKSPVLPYRIPKGNIFCRMEDAISRKSGVWLKVGTTDKIGR